jgi:hypothetical protein
MVYCFIKDLEGAATRPPLRHFLKHRSEDRLPSETAEGGLRVVGGLRPVWSATVGGVALFRD